MHKRQIFTLSCVALSASCLAAFRLFLFAFRYDDRLMHYTGKWEELTVLLLSLVCVAVFILLARKNGRFGEEKHLLLLPRIGLAPAIAGIAMCVILLAILPSVLIAEAQLALTISAIVIAGASISFIILSIPTRESFSLFVLPTLAPIFYAAYRYYDLSVPMNSPKKQFELIAAIVVSFAFLSKCRNIAAKKAPRLAFAATAVAAVFSFAEGLPRLVYAALQGDAFDVIIAIFFLAVSVYLAAMLYDGMESGEENEVKAEEMV